MKLRRILSDDSLTYGQLIGDEERMICVTLELPWRENAHDVSCIPPGDYVLRRRWSPKHKCELFGVEGVPDRADIEIHPANFTSDLLGCIGLGVDYGQLENKQGQMERGIVQSRRAFATFMALMIGKDNIPFTVLNPEPTT